MSNFNFIALPQRRKMYTLILILILTPIRILGK